MRIDLTPLLEGKQSQLEIEGLITPEQNDQLEGKQSQLEIEGLITPEQNDHSVVLPKEIKFRGPIRVRCTVTDKSGYLTLIAAATADYDTVCDRCLEPISTSVTFSISRLIETGASIHAEDTEHDDDYEDSLLEMNAGAVDIEDEITEAFLLELPMVHLCREDCPGLCPRCGKRLSEGDCGCSAKKEIDPRLAKLQKLLEKPE